MPELAAGVEDDAGEEVDPEEDPGAAVDEPGAEVDEPGAAVDEPDPVVDEPGAEVDEPGAVAASVVLEAAPPQPATAASTTSKERGRRKFFKVTSDPFVEVSVAEAGPVRSCLLAAMSTGGNCFCLVCIYECSGLKTADLCLAAFCGEC